MWSGFFAKRAWRALPDELGPARAHLRALAGAGRPAGSAAERDALDYCAKILRSHGFSVTEEPFVFSAAVGRWMVPAVAGVMTVALGTTAVLLLAGTVELRMVGVSLLITGLLLAVAGYAGARQGVRRWPTHRVESCNLVATRGNPACWLVAHIDSKSQPIPTLVRAGALVTAGAAWLVTIVGCLSAGIHPAVPLVGMIAGAVASFSTVGNESPGAADNATGVAACLRVAETLPHGASLGIVLMSGEELGLAGARVWVRGRAPGRAINIDTLDESGGWRCMVHGAPSRLWARTVSAGLEGLTPRLSPIIPGLLTDGVALADAGWEAITLSRGHLGTLARIHRPADSVRHLTGGSVEALARALTGFLNRLT